MCLNHIANRGRYKPVVCPWETIWITHFSHYTVQRFYFFLVKSFPLIYNNLTSRWIFDSRFQSHTPLPHRHTSSNISGGDNAIQQVTDVTAWRVLHILLWFQLTSPPNQDSFFFSGWMTFNLHRLKLWRDLKTGFLLTLNWPWFRSSCRSVQVQAASLCTSA